MAVTIDQAFANNYSALLYMLSQQKGSRFAMAVRNETVTKAEYAYFNRIGPDDDPEQKVTRHAATPLSEPDISRRRAQPLMWHMGTPLDDDDLDRMKVEPTNWVVQTQMASLGRKKDKIIRDAALGTAYIGKEGGSTVNHYDESRGINGDGTVTTIGTLPDPDGSVSEADISLAKIATMLRLFNDEDVDPNEEKYWAITPKDIEDMLQIEQLTSGDYVTLKAIQSGKPGNVMGFNWLMASSANYLPNRGIIEADAAAGTGHRTFAWAKTGIVLATIGEISTRIDERKDLSYLTQVYSKMDLGAVRMEGAKVHECLNKIA